jgi:hypothetical protein
MHMDIQIVLDVPAMQKAGQIYSQKKELLVSLFARTHKCRLLTCAIHMHVANLQLWFILAFLFRGQSVV